MTNVYSNTSTTKIASSGGAVRVTLASGVGQGNDGTELICKGCFVQAEIGNSEVVRVNIGTAASATLGMDIGRQEDNKAGCAPLFIPIDDVSKLYFYSDDDNAIVDILYLRGGE